MFVKAIKPIVAWKAHFGDGLPASNLIDPGVGVTYGVFASNTA